MRSIRLAYPVCNRYHQAAMEIHTRVTSSTNPQGVLVHEDVRAALVQRVASSQVFQRSPKLRAFFLYVCDCCLRDGAVEEVKEQQIGVNVFHRRPDYNTSEDSIVRVQARELRKRLSTYFETEGKNEPWVIIIPKGGYLPNFVPAGSAAQYDQGSQGAHHFEAEIQLEPPSPKSALIETKRPAGRLAWLFGALVLLAIGWTIGAESRRWSPQPSRAPANLQAYSVYDQILGPIGRDGQNTLLALSNPRVILYYGVRGFSPAEIRDYKLIPVPPELRKSLRDSRNLGEDPDAPTYLAPGNETFTGIGEAACAFNIEKLMHTLNRSVQLTQERFLNSDVANREHLIILGSPQLSVWTHANVAARNFVPAEGSLRNTSPLPGERAFYTTIMDASGEPVDDYGIISMSTDAYGRRVLTLAGRTSAGTYGIGDFFVNPDKMKIAFDNLSAKTRGKPFPQNWEVLVHIRVRDNIPINTEFVTARSNDTAK